MWLPIISLRREDAARLGYDDAERWKELLTGYAVEMASSKAPASEPAVEAEVVGDKLVLTVRVVVFFGYPFKKLAEAVRAAVVAAIDAQVGVEVERVDVCIDGLVFPKE